MKIDTRAREVPATQDGIVECPSRTVRIFTDDGSAIDIALIGRNGLEIRTVDGRLALVPLHSNTVELFVTE